MKVEHLTAAFIDHRGTIMDIIQEMSVEHVAIFTSKAGSVRGNHYHKESVAYIFVIEGQFQIFYRDEHSPANNVVANTHDLVTVEPLERHSLLALEDSIFLMLVSGPKGGKQYVSDTVREQV